MTTQINSQEEEDYKKYSQALEQAHQRIGELTLINSKKNTRLIIAVISGLIITSLLTLYCFTHHRNEAAEIKIAELKETLLIFQGLYFEDKDYFIASQTSNKFRRLGGYGPNHVFKFNEWNKFMTQKILKRALELKSPVFFKHITSQINWDDNVDIDLANKINEVTTCDVKIAFEEIVENLPEQSKIKWNHFVQQQKKDGNATIKYIQNEYNKSLIDGDENENQKHAIHSKKTSHSKKSTAN